MWGRHVYIYTLSVNICWWLNNIKTCASFVIVIDIINVYIWKLSSFTSIISYFFFAHIHKLRSLFLLWNRQYLGKNNHSMNVCDEQFLSDKLFFLLFFHLSWFCLSCINNDAININSIQYVVLYSNEASRSPQQKMIMLSLSSVFLSLFS